MNYSTAELSTRALAEISQPDCAACNAIIDSIDRIARRGGDIHGKGWILRDLEVISANARGRPQIRTQVEFTPRTVRESKDSEPLRFEGGSTVYTFDLSHSPPIGWQVSRVIGVQQ